MAVFEYQALDSEGKEYKSTQEADNERQVRQSLRESGLTPLRIKPVNNKRLVRNGINSPKNIPFLGKKLSATMLAVITRQLATLIQASMPVEQALAAVAAQQEKNWVKNIVLSVRSQVMEGFTLAASLDAQPRHFPAMYRATVAAGEHAGHLDKVLLRLADYSEQSQLSRQKIKLALLYPVILMLAAIGIVSFLLGYVVPDVVKVFIDSGQKLPLITDLLITFSDWFQRFWLFLFGIVIIIVFIFYRLLSIPAFRLKWHKKILSFPVIGRFSKTLNTARFANTLSILTRSGVSLVDAMGIAARVLGNDKIRESIMESARSVSEGSSLYRALEKCGYFSPLMLHMISSGEATGELDSMLERTANNQQMELENRISMLVGLFEPLMLVVMGSVVMVIVLAILLPILNMNTLIGS